ncbi:MAG: type 4a pilus biogenesis protein PilO [Candidatus Gottesmanbacteria bacterium]|nr:type 4a pilus biogenesis protein PilO [Candidatus Gottesmanbacteria bacterium]
MQQLKKIFREYQWLIISIGILLMCGFGFVLGVVPLAQKAIDLNNEYSSLSAEVNALNNKASILQTIDEDTIRSNMQTLLSAVPYDKSLPTLLGTLDGLTAKTGVSVESFSLSKPGSLATVSARSLNAGEQAVGSNILPFTINVSGTFDQIRAFLTAATSVRRFFRIRTFDVSFVNADTVSANIAMDAFYSPIPSSIGSVSQPITALTSTDNDLIAKIAAMQLFETTSATLPPPSAGAAKPDPFSL